METCLELHSSIVSTSGKRPCALLWEVRRLCCDEHAVHVNLGQVLGYISRRAEASGYTVESSGPAGFSSKQDSNHRRNQSTLRDLMNECFGPALP